MHSHLACARPSSLVLTGFALTASPEPLPGGENRAWRVGDVVLKPVDVPDAQLEWQASLYESLRDEEQFRVPGVIRASDGTLVVEGWYATTFLPGRHVQRRWLDIVEVGEVFHAAIGSVRRPAFLDERTDPWSIGDRAAWGELPVAEIPETKHLQRLLDHLRPINAPSQLIHGDLTDNVSFDDELPPAVIDMSPYFRPLSFASAVIVADALVWEGADASLLEAFDAHVDFPQYLLRALIYRVVTDRLFRLDQPLRPDSDDPYRGVVDLAITASERLNR
jgi:uncharacterized protein (TIGR02569 family)